MGEVPKCIMWYVYIIKKNDKNYTGITTNIDKRLRQHGWARNVGERDRLRDKQHATASPAINRRVTH